MIINKKKTYIIYVYTSGGGLAASNGNGTPAQSG
jgi:hypothetical protein